MPDEIDVLYLNKVPVSTWLRGVLLAIRRPRAYVRHLLLAARGNFPRDRSLRLRASAVLTALYAIPLAAMTRTYERPYLHATFANEEASLAWAASELAGVGFGFRSHTSHNARDLPMKLRRASHVLSCSRFDKALLAASWPGAESKIVISYLGVDPRRFDASRLQRTPTDGARVLCVGTLQEKKGQRWLLEACAILHGRRVNFHCSIVGDGPDAKLLRQSIRSMGLEPCVEMIGSIPPEEVLHRMSRADIVCLPSVMAKNGDMDGIPVVLMEAMAAGSVCVSTPISGIPELIRHDVEGLLVPAADHLALADTLQRLIEDGALRDRLRRSARCRVEEQFDAQPNFRFSGTVVAAQSSNRVGTSTTCTEQ
jgi:glycosyltransferase involved in cell wall biosynthesis